MGLWLYFIALVGILLAVWLVSFAVEEARPVPPTPQALRWAADIPISYVDIAGVKLRYIKAGSGPTLLLLHTLRTQLDLFEKVMPALAKHFTVHALDYPGHGFSDIPPGTYDADFFVHAVEGFLEKLDLRDATLAGVSIGGAIALNIAGKRNPRVVHVVAINPYDYARGLGIARSSLLGRVIISAALVPYLGETVMRLRNIIIMKSVLFGGVAERKNIPPALLAEMNAVGNRPGHYRAFISLLRHAASWEAATARYAAIAVPVALIWGDRDWALPPEREHDHDLLPGAQAVTFERGGHFLPLDRPDDLSDFIVRFAGA
jgi:pimeloyl-ACP methyl ester carboxylesterase